MAKKKKEVEESAQIKELTDTLQRVQAEFINYKNRVQKENHEYVEYANAQLARKLLPVLDSFELAWKNTQDFEKFRQGIEMVYAQLLDILKQEGLSVIQCQGIKFDPYKHEVLLKEKSDKEEDMVLEELQKGYEFKGRVIRHSKVKVSGGC